MNHHNITLRICLTLLLVESLLLAVMGAYYVQRFWSEIDRSLATRIKQPGVLLEQRALNFDAVQNFAVFEEVISEKVVDAFITRSDGTIFYSQDPARVGQPYVHFLNNADPLKARSVDLSRRYQGEFTTGDGRTLFSYQTPLHVNDRLLGILFITIDFAHIKEKKNQILMLFILGSFVTVVLTTLLEALLVRRIFVPRIASISTALGRVEKGDLSARVTGAGVPDQVGRLITQVNGMISATERNIRILRLLNRAGEELFLVHGREDIITITVNIVDDYFSHSLTVDEKSRLREIFGEMSDAGELRGALEIFARDRGVHFTPRNGGEFFAALTTLVSTAMQREELTGQIRMAEEQYRKLFTTALEGIYKTNAEGRVLMANPAAAAMFGYTSVEELLQDDTDVVGRHYVDPEDRGQLLEKLHGEGRVNDYEIQFQRNDGRQFWASVSARVVAGEHQGEDFIEGRIVDITSRKKMEEAKRERERVEAASKAQAELLTVLEHNNEKLQQALEELTNTQNQLVQSEKMSAVGMTAGGVAHDLNNILAGLISYPEMLLLKLPENSEFRQPIKAILSSGKRAAAVVDDLLTLSRNAAQSREIVSLNSLVTEYFQSVEFQAGKKIRPGVRVETSLQDDLCNIECSPTHIRKVVMNLVLNGLEAVGDEGIITVATENAPAGNADLPDSLSPGSYVLLRVEDDGAGIRDEDLQHIFEPFYTRKSLGRSGTGLGLTVVWNVLQEHGGTVTVEQREHGTIFTVYLPATRKEITGQDERCSLEELEGKGRILVVDDEEIQRDVAVRMLAQLGYEVSSAASGEEALAFLQGEQVDLVVLDMLMEPGMNGRRTYEEILKLNPVQKAVAVSGFSESDEVRKALQLGVSSFLKKPFTMEQLGSAVRSGLASLEKDT